MIDSLTNGFIDSLLEHRNYDSDSIMDEEEMRCNAAALETAVQEEQRLKKQIEETEKAEIQVA